MSHIYRFGLASIHPFVSEALCGWASIGFIPDPACDLAADKQQTCTIAGRPDEIYRRPYGAVVPGVKKPNDCMVDRDVRCPEMRHFVWRVTIDSQCWGRVWRSRLAPMAGGRNPGVASGNEWSGLPGSGARGNAVDGLARLPYIKEGLVSLRSQLGYAARPRLRHSALGR
ncbi:hypothetical protein D9M68_806650 [compost metagenome]